MYLNRGLMLHLINQIKYIYIKFDFLYIILVCTKQKITLTTEPLKYTADLTKSILQLLFSCTEHFIYMRRAWILIHIHIAFALESKLRIHITHVHIHYNFNSIFFSLLVLNIYFPFIRIFLSMSVSIEHDKGIQ